MTDHVTTAEDVPSFAEIADGPGHWDASFHIGGHGGPGPDVKVIVRTRGRSTYVAIRRDGTEHVWKEPSAAHALYVFADELRGALRDQYAAVAAMPPRSHTVTGRLCR